MSQNFLPFPIFFRHIMLGNFHCVLTRLFLRDFSAVKIKKGLDEVKATQWAEKEKLDAKRNAALQVLQSQKRNSKPMNNIFIRTDPAGNIKADKAKSTEKIDGAIALIMALDRAIRCGNDTGESVYNSRGLIVF